MELSVLTLNLHTYQQHPQFSGINLKDTMSDADLPENQKSRSNFLLE